jgi:hypothetical protein
MLDVRHVRRLVSASVRDRHRMAVSEQMRQRHWPTGPVPPMKITRIAGQCNATIRLRVLRLGTAAARRL